MDIPLRAIGGLIFQRSKETTGEQEKKNKYNLIIPI
jgi:hypothetical protein